MLILDALFLAAVLALAAWRLFAPGRGARLRVWAVAGVAGLGVAQWLACGFTWQLLAAYLLLALSAWPLVRSGPALRWAGRLAFLAVAGAALGCWVLLAVPILPAPTGPYGVGTQIFRWEDPARPEPATDDPADHRNVIVQAWYPAAKKGVAHTAGLPYIDGLSALPPKISIFPSFMLRRFGQIDTHAAASAALPPRQSPWPVVIFSPGYGAPRAFYTGLATQLASRGFVVLALDHPYEAAVTQLADGRVVGPRENFLPSDPDRIQYMIGHQALRVADVRFVLDQIARPDVLGPQLSGRLDTGHVAVIGHSFGGATAVAALDQDPRVTAAANLDGTFYGPLPDHSLRGPFLLLQSDYAETHHSQLFIQGNAALLNRSATPGVHYEIKRANHFSFTDAPLFFSPPGRWLLARIIGGERGPMETQAASADILAAFLVGPLTGAPGDVAAAAARYDGVAAVRP